MKLVILAKTYPVPQRDPAKVETVCTGAIDDDGHFYRLYPVPFRLSEWESQYAKWEVIEADLVRHKRDSRKETFTPKTLVRTGQVIRDEAEKARRLAPAVLESWKDVSALRTKHKCSIVLCKLSSIELSWVENESRDRHAEVIEAHKNMLFEPEWLNDLKELHRPRNLIQVLWTDADGKEHKHRLFEWEYYKVLVSDYLSRGVSEGEAEAKLLERARNDRFRTENHEVWGLFGTAARTGTWLLGAVFNFSKASIQSAGEPLFAEPRLNPYEW